MEFRERRIRDSCLKCDQSKKFFDYEQPLVCKGCSRWMHAHCACSLDRYVAVRYHEWDCTKCRTAESPIVLLTVGQATTSSARTTTTSSARTTTTSSATRATTTSSATCATTTTSSARTKTTSSATRTTTTTATTRPSMLTNIPEQRSEMAEVAIWQAQDQSTLPSFDSLIAAADASSLLESTRMRENINMRTGIEHNVPVDSGDSLMLYQPFKMPQEVQEDSLEDDEPVNAVIEDRPFEVTLIKEGSRKGKARLVDSLGYAYTFKCSKPHSDYWSCPVRGKGYRCPATVIQRGSVFCRGKNVHNHAPKAGNMITTKLHAAVRKEAREDKYRSASAIVHAVLLEKVDNNQPATNLPAIRTLVRITNRTRQGDRPVDPVDLNFVISDEHMQASFLQSDVHVGEKRHLIFATTEQLQLLGKAKRWFLDGTFRVIKLPFTQLFSVHAFVKSDDSIKQVPLAFVMMSGKSKEDYTAVFRELQKLVPGAKVKSFVVDFEAGLWLALHAVFPDLPITGCVFHWTQAVWRKVQALGLQAAYMEDDGMHKYIRKLLALPFLPEEHIEPTFRSLQQRDMTDTRVGDLLCYIEATWIESLLWSPATWSVFMLTVRTNNDVEGWHRRLNAEARRSHLPFYLLVKLLHHEAALVTLQVRLVKVNKLTRYQRTKYANIQGRLEDLWGQYCRHEKSASKLLRACSKIYDPIPDN